MCPGLKFPNKNVCMCVKVLKSIFFYPKMFTCQKILVLISVGFFDFQFNFYQNGQGIAPRIQCSLIWKKLKMWWIPVCRQSDDISRHNQNVLQTQSPLNTLQAAHIQWVHCIIPIHCLNALFLRFSIICLKDGRRSGRQRSAESRTSDDIFFFLGYSVLLQEFTHLWK